MINKRGSIVISIVFSMLVFSVTISVLALAKTAITQSRQALSVTADYGGLETIANLATDEMLIQLNKFSASMEKTVASIDDYRSLVQSLDASIATADGIIKLNDVKYIIEAHIPDVETRTALLDVLGQKGNYSIICTKMNNIEVDELQSENIQYEDGDILALTPLKVKISFTCQGARIDKTILIRNLKACANLSQGKTSCYIDYKDAAIGVCAYTSR